MRRRPPQDDLAELALFTSMGRRHLAALDRLFDRLDPSAGTTLLRRNRPMDWLWVVVDGQLLATSGGVGRRTGPGECYGVADLLAQARSSADLIAEVDSHVLVMGRRAFLGALDSLPGFARAVLAPGVTAGVDRDLRSTPSAVRLPT